LTTSNAPLRGAVLSVLVLYVGAGIYVARECRSLWPYWRVLLTEHGPHLFVFSALLIGNLICAIYLLARSLALRETGRKLVHFEKQLMTGDSVAEELAGRLRGQQ